MEHTAKCACGSATITVSGTPVAYAVCHCDNCKKRTGSAFGVSAYFSRKAVSATEGQMTRYALYNPHRKEDQERYFCSKCGTTLYWYSTTYPEFVGIAGGCFADDPLEGEPSMTASHGRKLAWVGLPEGWRVVPEP